MGDAVTKLVGFYKELGGRSYLGALPSISDAMEEAPAPDEEQILTYLESCPEIFSTQGAELDVISNDERIAGAGSLITDGMWVWPIDLIHYLRRYHLALPGDFLEHVRENNYQAPEVSKERCAEVLDIFLPSRCPERYVRPTGGFISWFFPAFDKDDCRRVLETLGEAGLPVMQPSSGNYFAGQYRPGQRVAKLRGSDIRGLINELSLRLQYHDVSFQCWLTDDRSITAYARKVSDDATEITFELGGVAPSDQQPIEAALVRAFDPIHETSYGFVIDRRSVAGELDWGSIMIGETMPISTWPDIFGFRLSLVGEHAELAQCGYADYGTLAVFRRPSQVQASGDS